MAMDELERAMLDSRVNPACSSRIFLHMMPELNALPADVVSEWKKVMDTMISRHATRLLKLRVDEIEVKARVAPSDETSEVRSRRRRGHSLMLSLSLSLLMLLLLLGKGAPVSTDVFWCCVGW